MDENNILENSEELEENAAEEMTSEAESACEECCECEGECGEEDCECGGQEDAENPQESVPTEAELGVFDMNTAPKKSKKGMAAGIVIAAVLAVIVILLGAYLVLSAFGISVPAMLGYNKYNHMGYSDTSGTTLADMCDQLGVSLEEFKEQYELPEDMPGSTYFNAAYNMMPAKIIAAINMTDFATLKEAFELPDMTSGRKPVEITEDTPWGMVWDEVTLKYYVGEEYLDDFRNEYGFGEEVTLDTKVGEVRKAMEKKDVEERKKAEKEEAEQEDAETDESVDAENGSAEENAAGAEAEAEVSEDAAAE